MGDSETIEEVLPESLQGVFQNLSVNLMPKLSAPKTNNAALPRARKPTFSKIMLDPLETKTTQAEIISVRQKAVRAVRGGVLSIEDALVLPVTCGERDTSVLISSDLLTSALLQGKGGQSNKYFECSAPLAVSCNGAVSVMMKPLPCKFKGKVSAEDDVWDSLYLYKEAEKFKEFLNSCDLITADTNSESLYQYLVHAGFVESKLNEKLVKNLIEEATFKLQILEQYSQCATFIKELVNHQPYLKYQDGASAIYDILDKGNKLPHFKRQITSWAIRAFCETLRFMEGDFPSDLREDYKDDLFWIIDMQCMRECQMQKKMYLPFFENPDTKCVYDLSIEDRESDSDSDTVDTETMSDSDTKDMTCEDYIKELRLHKRFDQYLKSCNQENNSVIEELLNHRRRVPRKYKGLPDELIRQSIEVQYRNMKRRSKLGRIKKFAINYLKTQTHYHCNESRCMPESANPEYLEPHIERLGMAWANKIVKHMGVCLGQGKLECKEFKKAQWLLYCKMECYREWIEDQVCYDSEAYEFFAGIRLR